MEEDAEFREMITKKLEATGFLQKIRAKLRSHIYNAIDQDINSTTPNAHQKLSENPSTRTTADYHPSEVIGSTSISEALSTTSPMAASGSLLLPDDETIALHLVQDLLDCLNLSYTSSVFRSEIANRLDSQSTIREMLQIEQFDEEMNSVRDISDRLDGSGRSDLDEDSLECTAAAISVANKARRKPMLITVLQRFAGFISNNRNDNSQQQNSSGGGDSNLSTDENNRRRLDDDDDGAVNNETFISNIADDRTMAPGDITSESL